MQPAHQAGYRKGGPFWFTRRGEKVKSQARQRVYLRVNPDLIHLVHQVAEAEGISPAGALDRLLLDGLQRFAEGEIDFDGYRNSAGRGWYAWTVEINPNGLEEAISGILNIT